MSRCIVIRDWRGFKAKPEPQEVPGGIAIELEKRGFLKILRDEEPEVAMRSAPEKAVKRKRGRPKGSKNKVKRHVANA